MNKYNLKNKHTTFSWSVCLYCFQPGAPNVLDMGLERPNNFSARVTLVSEIIACLCPEMKKFTVFILSLNALSFSVVAAGIDQSKCQNVSHWQLQSYDLLFFCSCNCWPSRNQRYLEIWVLLEVAFPPKLSQNRCNCTHNAQVRCCHC